MKKVTLLCFILILTGSGCGLLQDKGEQLAPELASDGIDEFRSGNYQRSIEYFEQLKDWYPFDKYATLAELKIADAHYQLKEYDEAIAAYENFESLHPRNEAIPYVIYQIGMCYFERIDTVDRDQSNTQKALETFRRLMHQFPDDVYALRSRKKAKQCTKSLAGHELHIGMFYFKSGHYKAALHRFNSVISNYPDVGTHKQALEHITLCNNLLAEQAPEQTSESEN